MKYLTPTLLATTALIVSIVSICASLLWKKSNDTHDLASERLEQLEREIAHLKGGVYHAGQETADDVSTVLEHASTPPPSSRFESIPSPDQQELSHVVEEMRWVMTTRGVMPATPEHIQHSRELIFDEKASNKEKLVALRVLKFANKRTDDIARKMVEVYYGCSDFNMQAEIFNHLDGMDTPELVQPLLEASSSSPNARVRKEAVDALSGFLPDPDLLKWLKQLATSDSDKDVRREAERLLEKHKTETPN